MDSMLTLFLSVVVLVMALILTFGWRRRPRVRLVGASLFLLAGALFYASANFGGFHFKSGTMRCTVQQIDRQGLWSKTWEGVLVGPSRLPWHVSVVNDAPANMLREAMQNNRDVLVHYDEFRMRGWLLGSSDVVVTAVEP